VYKRQIYECKADRGDFHKDLRSSKWMRYLPYCNRFAFATPAGMLKKTEVPEEAGLIVLGSDWRTVRMAPHRADGGLGEHEYLSLLFASDRWYRGVRDVADRKRHIQNAFEHPDWPGVSLRSIFGREVAERLQACERATTASVRVSRLAGELIAFARETLEVDPELSDWRAVEAMKLQMAGGFSVEAMELLQAVGRLLVGAGQGEVGTELSAHARRVSKVIEALAAARRDGP